MNGLADEADLRVRFDVLTKTRGLAAVVVRVGEFVVGGLKREEMVKDLPGAIATACRCG